MQQYQFEPSDSNYMGVEEDAPLKIASVGDRLLGWLVDVAITVVVFIIVLLLTGILGGIINETLGTVVMLLGLAAWVIFLWAMVAKTGQTPGKKVMNTKVVKADAPDLSGGIGFGSVILREIIGKFLSSFFFMLGYLWIIFDGKNQGFHDKIASTVVIKLEQQN